MRRTFPAFFKETSSSHSATQTPLALAGSLQEALWYGQSTVSCRDGTAGVPPQPLHPRRTGDSRGAMVVLSTPAVKYASCLWRSH